MLLVIQHYYLKKCQNVFLLCSEKNINKTHVYFIPTFKFLLRENNQK